MLKCLLVQAVTLAIFCYHISYGSSDTLDFRIFPKNTPVNQGNDVLLQCTANRQLDTLKIKRRYSNTNVNAINQSNFIQLNITSVSCDKMDSYICEGGQDLNKSIDLDLEIYRCPPTLCPNERKNGIIFASGNETRTLSFCVVAYPSISSSAMINSKTIRTGSNYTEGNLIWDWNFKDVTSFMFNVTVSVTTNTTLSNEFYGEHVFSISSSETGHKKLNYTIEVRRPGKPECPTNIKVVEQGSSFIKLSWKPGFDGGSTQSFHISYHKDGTEGWSNKTTTENTTVNITDLEEKTTYEFKIIPSNKNDRNESCDKKSAETGSRSTTTKLTTSTSSAVSDSSPTSTTTSSPGTNEMVSIIIPVVSVLGVLIIAAVVVCVIVYLKINKMYTSLCPDAANNPPAPVVQLVTRTPSNDVLDSGADEALMTVANSEDLPTDSGRYISDQGLVYVTVDHSQHPRRLEPGRARPGERVQYSTINFEKSGKYVVNNFNEYKSVSHSREKIYANM